MTDSSQIAIPCFAGTGAKEARDDGFIADRCAKEARDDYIKGRSPRKRGLCHLFTLVSQVIEHVVASAIKELIEQLCYSDAKAPYKPANFFAVCPHPDHSALKGSTAYLIPNSRVEARWTSRNIRSVRTTGFSQTYP